MVCVRQYGLRRRHRERLGLADDDGRRPMPGIVGNLCTLGPVRSELLNNERPVYVWLPPSYSEADHRTYPVLYMHDGQNLFSDDVAFGREWQVDEAMHRLQALGLQAIIVGIPNAG